MATALRKEVLGLYRACMRSAHKCPEWEQREMMKTYVRMKFRHEMHTKDITRIKRMLADAREELAQMEYYHSVYEEKQRQRAAATTTPLTSSTVLFVNSKCPDCGTEYSPPQAKFCSQCDAISR